MRMLVGSLVLGLGVIAPSWAQDAKDELKKLQGAWEFIAAADNGTEIPAEKVKGGKLIITDNQAKLVPPAAAPAGAKEVVATIKLDPSKTPKSIDLIPTTGPEKDQPTFGIYQIDGDTLKIGLPAGSKKDRPTAFESKPDKPVVVITLKRAKP